jgi:FMN reductase
MTAVSVLAVIASPSVGGRTTTAARAMLDAAQDAGASVELRELASTTTDDALAAIDAADAVLFGSPVYRAGHTALLRSLLESTQRGMYGEATAPLRGKTTAIVMTGASAHHYLAPDGLRSVLASFFAAQVLSPSLYLDGSAFTPEKTLTDSAAALAAAHGAALVELAAAVRSSKVLSTLEPQV